MIADDDPKPALRALFRRARAEFVATLTPADRDRLARDLARVAAPALVGAAQPASYAAIGDEIDPVAIEAALGAHGFPRIGADRRLTFHRAGWSDLVPGPLGIPQPGAAAPAFRPDLLLVPLLAATAAGVRLGQGGGYYDRALAGLRAQGPVTAIGLAWDVQIADTLPDDPWDARLDWVATPTRLFDCRRPG